jgi:acyl carrier protein
MLGLEQDLEAELGIDSIKRVEILGAMQKSLPAAVAEGMQSQMESLTRVKSLKGIIEQVLSLLLPAGVGEAKDMGKS